MENVKMIRNTDFNHLCEFAPSSAVGRYQFPALRSEHHVPQCLIDFSAAMRSVRFDAGVHFYLDDSRFERVWRDPIRYLKRLKKFDCIFTPDFSLYLDMPMAMKIWNVYRSRLLGQMMQQAGLKVIPSVSWAEPATFEFCFDGLPSEGTVSVSTVGTMRTLEARKLLERGFRAMMERLIPEQIIVYGKCPDFIKNCPAEIHSFPITSFAWKNGARNVSYKEIL